MLTALLIIIALLSIAAIGIVRAGKKEDEKARLRIQEIEREKIAYQAQMRTIRNSQPKTVITHKIKEDEDYQSIDRPSRKQEDDILLNPLHPLNPVSPFSILNDEENHIHTSAPESHHHHDTPSHYDGHSSHDSSSHDSGSSYDSSSSSDSTSYDSGSYSFGD